MNWKTLQKPITGMHWWYRLLTGRKWTYPYCGSSNGRHYYWKMLKECRFENGISINEKRECKLLNSINIIKMCINRIKSKVHNLINK